MSEKQDDIIELKYPESIRTRPGMYIGELDEASILLREVLDNSMDEVYNSESCNKILVYNLRNKVVVADSGRGIPIKKMPSEDVTMAYKSLYSIHAGSKFNKTTAGIGMNGVGTKCVNALSNEYILIVKVDESKISKSTELVKNLYLNIDKSEPLFYMLRGEKGILKEEKLIKYSEIFTYIPELDRNKLVDFNIGTLVSFVPDETIFTSTKIRIPNTLRYFKYIVNRVYDKEVKVFINDVEYTDFYKPYEYEVYKELESDYDDAKNPYLKLLVSLQFSEDFDISSKLGSVNGLIVNQGHHINWVLYCFREAYKIVFPGFNYKGLEDKGIDMSIIAICPEPSYSSQTKERCSGIPGIDNWDPLVDEFVKFIKNNIDKFTEHNKKLVEYIAMTQDLSKREYIKSKIPVLALDGSRRTSAMTPLKVKTCSTRDREKAELFIVEGQSAGGSLMQARDARFHAVLPLRGKPLSAAALSIETILENEELKDLIATIGTGVDDLHSLDKVNYGKIIICADADPDGSNICSLVLGCFFAHMSYLIEAGMVYICDCPLYKQDDKFFYQGDYDKVDFNRPVQRFKGLGEMDPDEMRQIACDPATRRLIRITPKKMGLALRLITSTYARKQLLINNGIIDESRMLTASEIGL